MIAADTSTFSVPGLPVSEKGDLANWLVARRGGGASAAHGPRGPRAAADRTMEHVTARGEPKILKQCTYPLTAKRALT